MVPAQAVPRMTAAAPRRAPFVLARARAARWIDCHYRGILIAVVGGICALGISQHYGAPPMLIAVLIGLAIHFVHEMDSVRAGIGWSARNVLRFGVALLGLRIMASDIMSIGAAPLLLVVGAMVATMLAGIAGARALGLSREFAALSGGSVAVCGASAAAAISSILPQDEESERSLAVVIAVVTLLATVAMIGYPPLVLALRLSPEAMGVILGGTIHDVAQVVAAGKAVSPHVGALATFVKLMRVAMLLPMVMSVYFWLGRGHGAGRAHGKVQYIPGFLIAFFIFAALHSLRLVPEWAARAGSDVSQYLLVIAITAIGVKTDLKSVLEVGWRPFILILGEALVMLAVVLGGIVVMG